MDRHIDRKMWPNDDYRNRCLLGYDLYSNRFMHLSWALTLRCDRFLWLPRSTIYWIFVELIFLGHDRPIIISALALLSSFSMAVAIILIERRPGLRFFFPVFREAYIRSIWAVNITPFSRLNQPLRRGRSDKIMSTYFIPRTDVCLQFRSIQDKCREASTSYSTPSQAWLKPGRLLDPSLPSFPSQLTHLPVPPDCCTPRLASTLVKAHKNTNKFTFFRVRSAW